MDQPVRPSIHGRIGLDSRCSLKLEDFFIPERKNPRAMRHKYAESERSVGKNDRIDGAAVTHNRIGIECGA